MAFISEWLCGDALLLQRLIRRLTQHNAIDALTTDTLSSCNLTHDEVRRATYLRMLLCVAAVQRSQNRRIACADLYSLYCIQTTKDSISTLIQNERSIPAQTL